ncbi:RXT2-like protein [Chaetomium sp. MPI-CAGE-AT-0009]|nr:RXT2-like protein [Chaetomium sp. MPI-CAGE-AT-0009]
MSTQQQAMIMDTLLTLKRTLKRKAYDSDSDSSIDQTTNRGNKLKRRARFVHEGRLASSMGPAAYKEIAEHAGYQRAIINRNPPLIDDDGYDIDSDDDEEQVQEAIASALEENPYSSIRLEQILAPLTAVTDLPSHPTFSRPFTSKSLDELIEQGRNLMQKENKALWKAKPLLTKLVGDNTWAPCGLMAAPDNRDAVLFSDTVSFFNRPAGRVPTKVPAPGANGNLKNTSTESALRGTAQDVSQTRAAALSVGNTGQNGEPGEKAHGGEPPANANTHTYGESGPGEAPTTTQSAEKDGQASGNTDHEEESKGGPADGTTSSSKLGAVGGEDVEMAEASGADQERPSAPSVLVPPDLSAASPFPETLDELFIHPLFRLPPAARPDRDLGLPEQEAEEVRRLLLLYVQKQEEICRGTKRLYEGLLKADRLRQTVWQWAKAEAHCGPNRDMSDGEDWYDKEAWGLTEDLKKGEDEVEEDTAAQTQKKTRNRK